MTYGGRNDAEWMWMSAAWSWMLGNHLSPKKSMPHLPWHPGNSVPSCPAANRMAWRRRSMFSQRKHGLCVLFKGAARVGGIGSSPKYSRPSSAIHLLLLNCLNQQIMFPAAQRMTVCNREDKRQEQPYCDPQGCFFSHVVLNHWLAFSLHHHSPESMPTSPYHVNLHPPHLHAVSCVG